MNSIIAFIATRIPLVKRVWDAVDGFKTYLAGAGMCLTGIAAMVGAAAILVNQFAALTGFAADLTWLRGLKHDGNAGALLAGWGVFLLGLKTIGQRHALDKQVAPAAPPLIADGKPTDAAFAQPLCAAVLPEDEGADAPAALDNMALQNKAAGDGK